MTFAAQNAPADEVLLTDALAPVADVQSSLPLSIYQQPWWLDIAKGSENYREYLVKQKGAVVASLSFIIYTNKAGLKVGLPPIVSRIGGPILSPSLDAAEKAEALRMLLSHLPRSLSFRFVLNSTDRNLGIVRAEFARAGFKRRAEKTYWECVSDPHLLQRLSRKHRKHFKYAERDMEIVDINAREFTDFYGSNLKAAGKESYASLQIIQQLIEKGQENTIKQARVFAAKRRGEKITDLEAAIACVWDGERYYLWMITRPPSSKVGANGLKPHRDAVKYLILKATEHARSLGLIFDADGAITSGAHKLYGEVLQFPHIEDRDVFVRNTWSYAFYTNFRNMTFRVKPRFHKIRVGIIDLCIHALQNLKDRLS